MTQSAGRALATALLVALVFTGPAHSADTGREAASAAETEQQFVQDMTRRLAAMDGRIEMLEESMSRSNDMFARQMPMRGSPTDRREFGSRPGDLSGADNDLARIKIELQQLKSKARNAAKRLRRHETTYVRGSTPDDSGKAEKSRRKIGSRVSQLENDLDEIQRELRYLR